MMIEPHGSLLKVGIVAALIQFASMYIMQWSETVVQVGVCHIFHPSCGCVTLGGGLI
jgi:hypothetical protein